MRYMVEKNFVEVVGYIWMPNALCAYEYPISDYDKENIGEPTRENVEYWLALHSGDFREVVDFSASIGDTEIPWADEENELIYSDCMFPSEE